ncbi:MAG: PGPGW domain-containing protein [Acidobacteriota bacterium]
MPAPPPPSPRRDDSQQPEPLPPALRVIVLIAGWLLILIGVVGLVLPGIQGVLTLLLGAALLSLVSRTAHRVLRRLFSRWPRGWKRLLRLRKTTHRWLLRTWRRLIVFLRRLSARR